MLDRYNQVKSKISEQDAQIKRLGIQLETALEQVLDYQNKIQEYEELELLYTQVSQLYSAITRERTTEVKQMLEDVLNSALARIPMDAEYEAVLQGPDYTKANSTVEIKLVDKNSGKERTPLIGTGTMVAQLISFLMTAIVIKFSGKRRVMVLDEVLSGFYDQDSIRMFGEILVALSENEGFQFILVEHKSELAKVSGINVIEVEKQTYDRGLEIRDIYIGGEDDNHDS